MQKQGGFGLVPIIMRGRVDARLSLAFTISSGPQAALLPLFLSDIRKK